MLLLTAARYVVALTDAAITKIDALRARRARAADRALDTRRLHLWGEWYTLGSEACAYCGAEKTAANAHALCPKTGDAPR